MNNALIDAMNFCLHLQNLPVADSFCYKQLSIHVDLKERIYIKKIHQHFNNVHGDYTNEMGGSNGCNLMLSPTYFSHMFSLFKTSIFEVESCHQSN